MGLHKSGDRAKGRKNKAAGKHAKGGKHIVQGKVIQSEETKLACPDCKGRGKISFMTCSSCKGKGTLYGA